MEQQPKKSLWKRIFTFSHASFFLVLVLFGVTAYALFAPIVPARYEKPEVLPSSSLTAGQPLTYKIYNCRYVGDAVVTTVTRKLVSTTNKQLAPIVLSSDTLTNERRCLEVTRTIIVPSDTPAGEYQLIVQGVYQIIPLRKPITVEASSDSFVLKAADPNAPFVDKNSIGSPVTGSGSTTSPKVDSNSGASSATGGTTNNTTNNTTTNNTTNNNTQGSASPEPTRGLIPNILDNLLGIKITL